MWNIWKLATGPLKDVDTCKQWLRERQLIPTSKYCQRHRCDMAMREGEFLGRFRCRCGTSDHSVSVAKDTWFDQSRIPPDSVMLLTYAFTADLTYQQARRECSIRGGELSDKTICDRYTMCRDVCITAIEKRHTPQERIGGAGHVVEIDECKIGRRKYHRGRLVEGTWIVGMIDLNGEFRIEVCPENKRDRMTLATIIEKHVQPNTVIYTDCWKGYNGLNDRGYEHLTVNHSLHFRDPDTWCDTQKIEAQWRPLRRRLSRGGIRQEDLAAHLCEFLWKRECDRVKEDRFERMLNEIQGLTAL